MAYSLNEKTVLRGGYGKYFLNPTGQGNNAGFSQSTNVIASLDGNRTPTYALSNPWPNGIQAPPGSSLGPLTFLGRGPSFSNPDFVVPNVHQFSAGVQRELPWRMSLEATYAGSRSYDLEADPRLQRAVGGVPAAVRRHAGRQPRVLRPADPEPVLRRRRVRGHDALYEPDALALRAEPAVPGVRRLQPEPAQYRQADLRLGAVRGEQALHEGRHHQRQLHVCAAMERGRRLRGCGVGAPERSALLLAPPAPHHRVGVVGTALVPRRAQLARLPPRRLVDCAADGLPVAAGRGTCPATSIWRRASTSRTSRCRARRTGQFIYGVKPCIGQRNATTGQYTLLAVSTAYGCTEPYFLIREN